MFKKAVKDFIKVRLAISGPSGSGKTFSSLKIGTNLGKKVGLMDTENNSSLKYADMFDFDIMSLTDYHPTKYIEAIKLAEKLKYDVLIIDSLTHAWLSELELAGGKFEGWNKVRPLERQLIQAITSSTCHIICTMRSKTEYVMENYTAKDGNKKTAPKKIGTKPIQTNDIEYEFDIAGEMDYEHVLTFSKSRCFQLADKSFVNPGKDVADILLDWIKPPAWLSWKTPTDAIQWAFELLPDKSEEQLQAAFDVIEPFEGSKAKAWENYVKSLLK